MLLKNLTVGNIIIISCWGMRGPTKEHPSSLLNSELRGQEPKAYTIAKISLLMAKWILENMAYISVENGLIVNPRM